MIAQKLIEMESSTTAAWRASSNLAEPGSVSEVGRHCLGDV